MLGWGSLSRTKSFKPSTSFAVLWTVPSLLGAFSRIPSLPAGTALEALMAVSSTDAPALTLVGLSLLASPFCCALGVPLLPGPCAVLGRDPLETFCGVLEAGGGGEGKDGMAPSKCLLQAVSDSGAARLGCRAGH